MSFSKKSLVRTGYGPVGETDGTAGSAMASQFSYATKDADTVVEAAGYFNTARDSGLIAAGDRIDCTVLFGGSVERKDYVFDAVPASGNVTIALTSAS